MAIRIITDSTVDIADKYSTHFTVVPLTVSFGETDYIDGVTINKQEFYQKLVSSPVLPKTSQATPEAFAKVFRKLQENGDEAIVITVSSRLSGTYQSACIAAEDFPNVRVVDSLNVSIASGILALYAGDPRRPTIFWSNRSARTGSISPCLFCWATPASPMKCFSSTSGTVKTSGKAMSPTWTVSGSAVSSGRMPAPAPLQLLILNPVR